MVAGGNSMHLLDGVRQQMTCVPVAHEVAAGIAAECPSACRNGICVDIQGIQQGDCDALLCSM